MTVYLIDAQREAQDQRSLLGTVAMETSLQEFRLRLHFDFWTFACNRQDYDITFSHPTPPFNRLFIFFGTEGEVTMGGVKYRLKPEVFYLLPENCPFVATYLEGGELLFVHFTVTDQALHRIFAGLNRVLELDSPPRATLFGELRHSEWNGELQSLTVNVVWRLMSPDIRREMVLRNALVRQFGNIFQLLESTPPAQVRIAELSETVGMTPGALARKFQRHFGLTLKEFIDGRTLQQAQQLLLGGGDPVASIAERLGFGDPHYFYHFFQKHTGCTPHEFRLRQQ